MTKNELDWKLVCGWQAFYVAAFMLRKRLLWRYFPSGAVNGCFQPLKKSRKLLLTSDDTIGFVKCNDTDFRGVRKK